MLDALLQTIANLGFDAQSINQAFNGILAALRSGDLNILDGLSGFFRGFFSMFGGADGQSVSLIIVSLVNSIAEVLANANASSVFSTIIGA
ncbi:MAG: hypothetical protein IJK02_00130 [Clostridia bacterium]|nr:hypothetical protein [Clostridia bacterium]MBR0509730.1 hypothetical protein [Clostridia bacterium]MBR0537754.1 hypothetical protein [Clostridia bacterium]